MKDNKYSCFIHHNVDSSLARRMDSRLRGEARMFHAFICVNVTLKIHQIALAIILVRHESSSGLTSKFFSEHPNQHSLSTANRYVRRRRVCNYYQTDWEWFTKAPRFPWINIYCGHCLKMLGSQGAILRGTIYASRYQLCSLGGRNCPIADRKC